VPLFLGTFERLLRCDRLYQTAKPYLTLALLVLWQVLVTLPLLIWGLAHSTVVPTCPARWLNPDALNPNYSFLVALLSKLVLGTQLDSYKAIDLHPVAVAGFLGCGDCLKSRWDN